MFVTGIIIPAYNEAESIAQVVAATERLGAAPVVVIDDCSTDATAAIAGAAGATVLRLPLRLGAWGATQTGLRFAWREGWARAVTMDADGQHDPSEVPVLLEPLTAGAADVVIGACPSRVSPARQVAWRYFRWLSGIALEDLTSGFRAYNRDAIQRLIAPDATLLDYQDIGVLLILRRHGLRVREIPVQMQDRTSGKSHVFDSWWSVGRYLLLTSLLILAGVGAADETAVADKG